MGPIKTSWPDWTYPDWMDNKCFKTGRWWIDCKKRDDGAEGLWRIHGKLYDLNNWVDKHPGGKQWITLTKGLDITEVFEASHLNPDVEKLLPKFYVRDAKTPRNSPYTFEPNGFFRTLKGRIYNELKGKKTGAKLRSLVLIDLLVVGTLFLSVVAARFHSCTAGILAAICLTAATIFSHNFFHQKDNWRMYYFQLSLLSVTDWRISHSLSHHIYTNTHQDLEIVMMEPFLQWLPKEDKHWIPRYLAWLYTPVVYLTVYHAQGLIRICQHGVEWQDLIGLVIPAVMYLFSGASVTSCLFMWYFIIAIGSLIFGTIGFNAAHHHPDIFHEGDKARKDQDWGLNQIDAVRDRIEVATTFPWSHLSFGDHTLHHIFPTIDHDDLPALYPILEKTCLEFGVEFRFTTTWDLISGQFRQLSRVKINQISPEESLAPKKSI